ncbi:hypothetical protein [Aporhodopirellula aestuarii]|uniref:Uncharacterized protein n=1 Tax=Aporhodopirellula aestuarii TaxID=2950107 RepID=A0ABT0UDH6_9BACT|nr:hypothetical protein [Aporhodopirellula aestuarii]MCM2374943.1 hypothetical protein [Aporhodopirellula aestuarii]
MKRPPKFALSSLMFGTGFIAIGLAIVMNFGAFGLLLSAIATFVLLVMLLVADSVMTLPKRSVAISNQLVTLAATYCTILALYFASYGPATWLLASNYTHDSQPEMLRGLHFKLYSPVTRCIVDSPVQTIHDVGVSYLKWWLPSDVDFQHHGRSIGWYTKSKLNPSFGTVVHLAPP